MVILEETGDLSRQVAAGRWWEGPEWSLAHCSQLSSCLLLSDLSSFSTQEHSGSSWSQERIVHLCGSDFATYFSGSVNLCQAGVITIL